MQKQGELLHIVSLFLFIILRLQPHLFMNLGANALLFQTPLPFPGRGRLRRYLASISLRKRQAVPIPAVDQPS